MKIDQHKTDLQPVNDIEIPDIFYQRLTTGIETIDNFYGGGILPGSVATLTGGPGTGKSTFLLQTTNALAKQGLNVAYVSGEESQEMLAFTCQRLELDDILIATGSDVEQVDGHIRETDFLVYDSFQCLTSDGKGLNRNEQEQVIRHFVAQSKAYQTATTFTLHITKTGNYKGSTAIPHMVDVNFIIELDKNLEDVRNISSTKNRYGPIGTQAMYMSAKGFDFESAVEQPIVEKPARGKRNGEIEQIKQLDKKSKITVANVCGMLNVDAQRSNYLLRQMAQENILVKTGRGVRAVWKFLK